MLLAKPPGNNNHNNNNHNNNNHNNNNNSSFHDRLVSNAHDLGLLHQSALVESSQFRWTMPLEATQKEGLRLGQGLPRPLQCHPELLVWSDRKAP